MTQIGDKNKPGGAQSCSRLRCQFCTGRLFSARDSRNHQSLWFRMSKGDFSFIINWFGGGVFTCEGEAIAREQTWPNKNDAKGRGAHSYRLSQRNMGEDTPPPLFFCVLSCEEILACPVWECVTVPTCRPAGWRRPDSTVFTPLSTCCKRGVPPAPPHPRGSIHPSIREVRQGVWPPHCWPVRTRASFCYL